MEIMERTKGRVSMEEAAEGSSLVRTKEVCNKWRKQLSEAAEKVVQLVETNAFGYHSFHKEWLTKQPLRTILAYTHPTDRSRFKLDLKDLGVNF